MPNPLSRYGVSDRDYAAAVATAVGEAGREGVQGMAAVIDVLANRAENPQYADAYGNSVSEQATARKGREFNAWMSGSPRTQAAFAQTMRALRAMASPTARARLPKAEQAQLAQAEKAAFGVLGTGDLRGITKGATRYANKAVTKRWGTNSAQDALEGEFGRLNIGNHTFTGPGFDPSREYDPERAFRNLESNWAYAQGGDTPGERLAAGRQQQALRETFSGASDFGAPVWDGNWTGDTRVEVGAAGACHRLRSAVVGVRSSRQLSWPVRPAVIHLGADGVLATSAAADRSHPRRAGHLRRPSRERGQVEPGTGVARVPPANWCAPRRGCHCRRPRDAGVGSPRPGDVLRPAHGVCQQLRQLHAVLLGHEHIHWRTAADGCFCPRAGYRNASSAAADDARRTARLSADRLRHQRIPGRSAVRHHAEGPLRLHRAAGPAGRASSPTGGVRPAVVGAGAEAPARGGRAGSLARRSASPGLCSANAGK